MVSFDIASLFTHFKRYFGNLNKYHILCCYWIIPVCVKLYLFSLWRNVPWTGRQCGNGLNHYCRWLLISTWSRLSIRLWKKHIVALHVSSVWWWYFCNLASWKPIFWLSWIVFIWTSLSWWKLNRGVASHSLILLTGKKDGSVSHKVYQIWTCISTGIAIIILPQSALHCSLWHAGLKLFLIFKACLMRLSESDF